MSENTKIIQERKRKSKTDNVQGSFTHHKGQQSPEEILTVTKIDVLPSARKMRDTVTLPASIQGA